MRGTNRSSFLGVFILSALGAGGALLFQNCQGPVQDIAQIVREDAVVRRPAEARDIPAATFKTELEAASAPFLERKVHIGKVGGVPTEKVAQKSGRVVLPKGQRLVVILNNECADRNPGPIAAKIFSRDLVFDGLQTQSYKWVLTEDTPLEAIEAAADADDCVIGLQHDDVMRAAAMPNDPQLGQQKNFTSIGGADTFSFFNDPAHGAKSTVVVAVIDSGTNYAHEDLRNMLWHNPYPTAPAHDAVGYDFRAANYFPFDEFGHGTFVAGIIAAEANNGLGVTGVMGHDVQLMSLKVQGPDGVASIADIVTAIDYARSKSVDVINISMEGDGDQPTVLAAMNSAVTNGAFIVSAAGNSGLDLTAHVVIPAQYGAQISGALTVGSIDAFTGARSSFSNYSTSIVEIAAPGSNGVYSTNKSQTNNVYSSNQGTSFSAPLVSGAAALTISFFKKHGITSSPALVETTLIAAAVQNSSLNTEFTGGRTLDLRALAQYLQRTYLSPVGGGFDEN